MIGTEKMTDGQDELGSKAVLIAGQRLLLRPLRSGEQSDARALLSLHRAVFGSTVDLDWFDWKYRLGQSIGFGLWRDNELIAHCGGVPRRFWRYEKSLSCLQIGDVMVDPKWRGSLARKNPFALVSNAVYSNMLGATRPYQLGFGFPNERHMRLAAKTGLSWRVGAMKQLCWSTTEDAMTLGLGWRLRTLSKLDGTAFRTAWQAMCKEADLKNICIGERDWQYVLWRYMTRPDKQYRFVGLQRRWSTRVSGILVLSSGDMSQWMDWIGPSDLMPLACSAAKLIASGAGSKQLTAWCSPLVVECLKNTGIKSSETVAAIGVPVTSDLQPDQAHEFPWWFMGGDTDFL